MKIEIRLEKEYSYRENTASFCIWSDDMRDYYIKYKQNTMFMFSGITSYMISYQNDRFGSIFSFVTMYNSERFKRNK